MLRLELTETAAVTDFPVTRQRLAELRELGVGLSLDDFGTGYSSLRLLRDLAVDDVKVDRSFVQGLDVNGADAAMVRLVVETAHALGLTVTAEGVERLRPADRAGRARLRLGAGLPARHAGPGGRPRPGRRRRPRALRARHRPRRRQRLTSRRRGRPSRAGYCHGVAGGRCQLIRPSSSRSSASSPAAASASWVAITTTAPRVGLGPQRGHHPLPVGGVEVAGRLVGQQHRALRRERAGQRDPLLLAAGQLLDQVVAESSRPTRRSARPGGGRVGGRHARGQQRHQDVLLAVERRAARCPAGSARCPPRRPRSRPATGPRRPRRCPRGPSPRPAPTAGRTCPRRTAR